MSGKQEMKDSGIEWIGMLPYNWSLKKIKYCLQERIEKNNPIRITEILSLTAKQGVIPLNQREGGGNKPKEDISAYRLAYPGDIVMNSMNILSGSVGLSTYFGCVSPVYYMLRPIDKQEDVRFYNYIFQTTVFQRSLFGLGNGILIKESGNGKLNTIRMRIPMDKFGQLFIPVATNKEQVIISDFLDHKCTEIDALTASIEAEIETLEQYKQSVITEAVTKGLNPDVEMKDSGIEWICSIPSSWKIFRLKYVLSEPMKYGATESGIGFDEHLPRYIRITDITASGKLQDNGKLSLSEDQAKGYILQDGTVLFARSGATVGKTFLYQTEYGRAAFAGYLISASVDRAILFPKWLLYFTQSAVYREWINQMFSQATIQNIGADKYSNMPIPIAPLKDQCDILRYLDCKCTEIDSIIADKQAQLDTLAEYKKSLIYEYVTGKKEVPIA